MYFFLIKIRPGVCCTRRDVSKCCAVAGLRMPYEEQYLRTCLSLACPLHPTNRFMLHASGPRSSCSPAVTIRLSLVCLVTFDNCRSIVAIHCTKACVVKARIGCTWWHPHGDGAPETHKVSLATWIRKISCAVSDGFDRG